MRIAISGCGIAGPCLAFWLARAGHQPVLYERAPELRTGGYVVDFWGSGYDVAEKMGLIPRLLERGYRIERLQMVDAAGAPTVSADARVFYELTGGRYLTIPRSALSAELVRACDGIEIRFGQEVAGCAEADGGVELRTADGGAERFDLVVGADGLHSAVRAAVFGPEDRFEDPMGLVVAAFDLPGYRPRDELVYMTHTRPGCSLSRLALRDDVTICLLVFSESMLGSWPDGAEARRAAVLGVLGTLGWEAGKMAAALPGPEAIYFDRVSQIHMPAWHRGRVALLGDAGACASLLAGEGTGLAMTSAYVLAGELGRSAGDVEAALAAWEARLHPHLDIKQKQARRFAGFFAPKSGASLWLRDLGLRLTRVPGVGRLLMGSSFRNELELPDFG